MFGLAVLDEEFFDLKIALVGRRVLEGSDEPAHMLAGPDGGAVHLLVVFIDVVHHGFARGAGGDAADGVDALVVFVVTVGHASGGQENDGQKQEGLEEWFHDETNSSTLPDADLLQKG